MSNWKGVDPAQWAERAKLAIRAIRTEAVHDLVRELTTSVHNGGNVPWVTGNLGRSLVLDTKPISVEPEGTVFTTQDFQAELERVGAEETMYLGYQAAYARRQNYGFLGTDSLGRTYNQSGFGFMEKAAARWPFILEAAIGRVKKRLDLG